MKTLVLFTALHIAFLQPVKAQDFLYQESYEVLTEMLENPTKYSFKKAVFSVENAHSQGQLDSVYFNQKVRSLSALANQLYKSRTLKYEGKDKIAVSKYAALFSVLNDSIPIVDASGAIRMYQPFSYDFNDPFGHENWNAMMVSKLLETRKGNCHSLPYLYKIIAEDLEVEAHLALAPNHIYIKHKSEQNGWYNTELTSGIFPIDAWLMASGYVHLDAIRNGVYMKALNNNETIALCLIDLAQAYQKQEVYDLDFVIKCADKALEYFPNYVNAMILKSEAKGKQIEGLLYGYRSDFSAVRSYPKTAALFHEIELEIAKIHQLGYRQMPEEMYLDWLTSLKREQKKYTNKKITTFK